MAMTSKGMADYIIKKVRNIDTASSAINAFYSALCEYVEDNAEVLYSWAGFNSVGVPDPVVVIKSKIKTTGSLSPSGESTPEGALAKFSSDLNSQASLWIVDWQEGFQLSPAFVIPTILITPSMCDNMNDAWLSVCSQIIAGIKAATPSAFGSHSSYTGTATFTSIL